MDDDRRSVGLGAPDPRVFAVLKLRDAADPSPEPLLDRIDQLVIHTPILAPTLAHLDHAKIGPSADRLTAGTVAAVRPAQPVASVAGSLSQGTDLVIRSQASYAPAA